VFFLASYYRPPRRLPREESAESDEGPRRRDFIIFFICLAFFAVILFVGSYVAQALGRAEIGLSLRLVAALFTTATVGTCATVGIGYLLTRAFLKREFDKKFKKMDEEQQAELRRMTGHPDDDRESR
jgi:membrane protein YqaA with SNARE-associated domain